MTVAAQGASLCPTLRNGDRLSRAEFERRYDATPGLTRAELIDGVAYIPSPICHPTRRSPSFDAIAWLGRYHALTPCVDAGAHGSIRLDKNDMTQPVACVFVLPEFGGQAKIDRDGYVAGAPELIVEVAASSVSYDLNVKLNAYERNGVREYVVWRVLDDAIDWFVLRGAKYERLAMRSGVLRSEILPGLWLDAAALLAGDMAKVSDVQRRGIESSEHAAFVKRLQTRDAKNRKPTKSARPARRPRRK